MKRIFTSAIALFVLTIAFAQIQGNGYYRVKNYKSERYIYIADGTSSGIDTGSTSVDMGAIQLWKDNNLLTNPASVIYAEQHDTQWNFMAQGTGVYQLIQHYVTVTGDDSKNAYQVSATASGITMYLYDGSPGNANRSSLVTGAANGGLEPALRVWNIYPMNQDDNYIAVLPTLTVGDKHFTTYFASFPFSFYSEGLKAYYIKYVDSKLNIAVIAEIDGIVNSSTPVIIECSSDEAVNNKLQLEDYNGYKNAPADNQLTGVYFANKYRISPVAYKEYDKSTMRILGITSEGKLGFITATEDNLVNCGDSRKKIWCLPANTAYLPVPAGTGAELKLMTEEEYAVVGIHDITSYDDSESFYSIDGKQLAHPVKGLNIVRSANGKAYKIVK